MKAWKLFISKADFIMEHQGQQYNSGNFGICIKLEPDGINQL